MVRLLWLLLLFPAALALGALYQWAGALKDRRRFLGLGTMFDIGDGRRLYMSQRGSGGPSVIFESGIAATSQNWAQMQDAVSNFAHTVAYDRGGLGWSSPNTTERTPSNIVAELRLLLQQAGVAPPYVLVGHSFGGLIVRHFAAAFPDEVAGVVLVDPMRPEDWPPLKEAQRPMVERGIRLAGLGVPVARFGLARLATTSLFCRSGKASRLFSRAAGSGGLHVLDRVTCEVSKMPRWVWPIVAAHWSSPKFYRGLAAHLHAVPATVREMADAKPVIGIPLCVLTAGTAEPLSPDAVRSIGPEAEQVIAENCGHWVHLDDHALVLQTTREMVEQIRSNSAVAVETADELSSMR